jgi:hypothetical protein
MHRDNVLTPPNSSKLRVVQPHIVMESDDDGQQAPPNAQRTTAVRRSDAPPRNEQGDIYCMHEDCEDNPPTFRRACEWNKHMDRHERPYKCEHPNCLNSQGFTYSGGLLRHQREVHRMHQSATKARIFCPFPDCPRNVSGEGFSRKENLEEHKRRRHADQKTPNSTDDDDHQHARKRRRPPTPVPSEYSVKVDGLDADDHVQSLMHISLATPDPVQAATIDNDYPLVKTLRAELQQCQDQLRHVLQENRFLRGQVQQYQGQVQQYHSVLQNFPAPQIYSVGPGSQAGGHHHGGVVSPQATSQQFMSNAGNMMQSPHLGSMGGSAYKK